MALRSGWTRALHQQARAQFPHALCRRRQLLARGLRRAQSALHLPMPPAMRAAFLAANESSGRSTRCSRRRPRLDVGGDVRTGRDALRGRPQHGTGARRALSGDRARLDAISTASLPEGRADADTRCRVARAGRAAARAGAVHPGAPRYAPALVMLADVKKWRSPAPPTRLPIARRAVAPRPPA